MPNLSPSIIELIGELAKGYALDAALIQALVEIESAGNPWAVRFEPAWRYFHFPNEWASRLLITPETERMLQSCSWGLMQIMGSVAREYGFEGELHRLSDPFLSLKYGCVHLKHFLTLYGLEADAIAAYNAGSVRKTSGGMYVNETYVDKVSQRLRELRKLLS